MFELLTVNRELRAAIANEASLSTLEAIARESGMRSLKQDGLAKARAGITTVEEVLRVCDA